MTIGRKTEITAALCANAGVSVTTPHARIWVDALHDQHEETFSDVTPAIWESMKKHPDFRDPDVLVFTHKHGDHYSAGLLGEAMRLYPTARVILPAEETVREFSLCPDVPGGDMLYTIRTLHEGKAFTDVPHDAVLILSGGKKILLTGDMRIDRENAARLAAEVCELTGGQTGTDSRENSDGSGGEYLFDAVFAAFPWMTTTKGRTILRDVLRPRRTILYHIPFEEDDLFGYRKGVGKVLAHEGAENRVEALMSPFEKIVL